jgi:hypothetical protein
MINKRVFPILLGLVAIFAMNSCSKSVDQNPAPPKIDSFPSTITIASGDNQTAIIGKPLANPLEVTIKNKDGIGLKGVPVQFIPGPYCGQVSPTNALTDTSGKARTTWTLGNIADTVQTVKAIVKLSNGDSITVVFKSEATDTIWRRMIEDTTATASSFLQLDSMWSGGILIGSFSSNPPRPSGEQFGLEFPIFTVSTLVGKFYVTNDSTNTQEIIPFALTNLNLTYSKDAISEDQPDAITTHTHEQIANWQMSFNSDTTVLSGIYTTTVKDTYTRTTGDNEVQISQATYNLNFRRKKIH